MWSGKYFHLTAARTGLGSRRSRGCRRPSGGGRDVVAGLRRQTGRTEVDSDAGADRLPSPPDRAARRPSFRPNRRCRRPGEHLGRVADLAVEPRAVAAAGRCRYHGHQRGERSTEQDGIRRMEPMVARLRVNTVPAPPCLASPLHERSQQPATPGPRSWSATTGPVRPLWRSCRPPRPHVMRWAPPSAAMPMRCGRSPIPCSAIGRPHRRRRANVLPER